MENGTFANSNDDGNGNSELVLLFPFKLIIASISYLFFSFRLAHCDYKSGKFFFNRPDCQTYALKQFFN